MSNYTPTGAPAAQARGATSPIRGEFILIQTAIASKSDSTTVSALSTGNVWTGVQNFTGATTTVATQAALDASTKASSTAYADSAVAAEAAIRLANDNTEIGLRTSADNLEIAARIAADNLKAPLASPALTGVPTAPTALGTDSSTTIATTSFVAANFASLTSPAFTGTPTVPTAAPGTQTTQAASTAFVAAAAFATALPGQPGGAVIQNLQSANGVASWSPLRGRTYFASAQ